MAILNPHALFVPRRFAEDLEADGMPPGKVTTLVNERKRDIGRVEGALEQLGIPFKHEKVGTSATLSAAEVEQLLALLPPSLPARCELDIHPA